MVRDLSTNEQTGTAFVPAQASVTFSTGTIAADQTATFQIGTGSTYTYTVPTTPVPANRTELVTAIVKDLQQKVNIGNANAVGFRNDISSFEVDPNNPERILIKGRTDVAGGQPLNLTVGGNVTNSHTRDNWGGKFHRCQTIPKSYRGAI